MGTAKTIHDSCNYGLWWLWDGDRDGGRYTYGLRKSRTELGKSSEFRIVFCDKVTGQRFRPDGFGRKVSTTGEPTEHDVSNLHLQFRPMRRSDT